MRRKKLAASYMSGVSVRNLARDMIGVWLMVTFYAHRAYFASSSARL